jgi:hypothetical protein
VLSVTRSSPDVSSSLASLALHGSASAAPASGALEIRDGAPKQAPASRDLCWASSPCRAGAALQPPWLLHASTTPPVRGGGGVGRPDQAADAEMLSASVRPHHGMHRVRRCETLALLRTS